MDYVRNKKQLEDQSRDIAGKTRKTKNTMASSGDADADLQEKKIHQQEFIIHYNSNNVTS